MVARQLISAFEPVQRRTLVLEMSVNMGALPSSVNPSAKLEVAAIVWPDVGLVTEKSDTTNDERNNKQMNIEDIF